MEVKQRRILLAMWDTLAERASLHLKPNDYIYVSGHLGSYTKSALQGTERLYYKVTANEFNYVQVPDESFQVISKSGFEAGESSEERHRSRLLLWQLLFAHPDEWYDNRQMKTAPRHPDFKHKSTGEALWLNKDDPPWVKKQIELMESEFIGRPRNNMVSESFPSEWVFDEQL